MGRLKQIVVIAAATAALLGAASAQSPRSAAPVRATPSPEVAELRRDLQAILREPGWEGARYGAMVVSLDRGDTLFALNPDVPLSPASNMKLYSTAAALYYLGPEYRYSTYLLAGGPIREGALEGDLILYGTGDPSISGRMLEGGGATLRAMTDTLLSLGIREVRGDVVGDGSYFDARWTGPGWLETDLGAWYGAPVGALSFSENIARIEILPGAVGSPARIRTTPETRQLALENRVTTVASGATRIRFERGPDRLIVTGQIPRGRSGAAYSVPVVDPTNFAAAALRAALEEKGIRVTGAVRTVHDARRSRVGFAAPASSPSDAPPPRVLAVHFSPPLADIAAVTNHVSHNLFAEALLKTVGRVVFGEGSFAAGTRAVRYLLECETATDAESVAVIDGSGLSRNNRLSARAIIHLLDYMRRSSAWESYHESLPQAGNPDGLSRMGSTPAAGNLRAKTGTIRQVSSLSGYVRAANGELLAFSIVANDVPSTWRQKRSEDAVGARLARFSRPRSAGGSEAVQETPRAAEERAAALERNVTEHRVRPGETLDGIARRFGTTVRDLQGANPGLDARRLQVGQRVRIPR